MERICAMLPFWLGVCTPNCLVEDIYQLGDIFHPLLSSSVEDD